MKDKFLKILVFAACGLTLGGGSLLTYRMLRGPVSGFAPDSSLPRLASEPESPKKHASLLSTAPYTEEVTRKAENRVRSRSPAFQREATLDEKTLEKFKGLIRSRKLVKEDEQYKPFIPDETGAGFLVRALVLIELYGKAPNDSGLAEGADFIRTYFAENAAKSIESMDQALASLPREYAGAKTLLMTEMARLGRERSNVRVQVKNSLLQEYGRAPATAQGAQAMAILLQVRGDEKWIQEVRESFEKAHPGEDFSEVVSVQRASSN